jgi:hypothetical protein
MSESRPESREVRVSAKRFTTRMLEEGAEGLDETSENQRHIRAEFMRVHGEMRQSLETERVLILKLREMKDELVDKSIKLQWAHRMKQEDEQTISQLRGELQDAQARGDLAEQRETQAQGVIRQLTTQVRALKDQMNSLNQRLVELEDEREEAPYMPQREKLPFGYDATLSPFENWKRANNIWCTHMVPNGGGPQEEEEEKSLWMTHGAPMGGALSSSGAGRGLAGAWSLADGSVDDLAGMGVDEMKTLVHSLRQQVTTLRSMPGASSARGGEAPVGRSLHTPLRTRTGSVSSPVHPRLSGSASAASVARQSTAPPRSLEDGSRFGFAPSSPAVPRVSRLTHKPTPKEYTAAYSSPHQKQQWAKGSLTKSKPRLAKGRQAASPAKRLPALGSP